MPTPTANFGYNLPLVNNATDADLWGGQLNSNWSDLDADLALTTSDKLADFNVAATEFNFTYIIDASGGNVTASLPASSAVFAGFAVRFKVTDASNTVTVAADGAETIDGSSTVTITATNGFLACVNDGTNWQIYNQSSVPIANAPTDVVALSDEFLFSDTSDGNSNKKDTIQGIVDLFSNQLPSSWVSFNGSGTPTISDNFNVASVTTPSTGRFVINFTASLSNANYAVLATSNVSGSGGATNGIVVSIVSRSTNSVTIECTRSGGTTSPLIDPSQVSVMTLGG